MNKLKSFVRLDFLTVKPYFTVKTTLIFAALALFLTTVSNSTSAGIGVGMMLGTLFIGYPFAAGEKSNMDALYATLSVSRKTVVLGRYVFALSINICTVLFSFVLVSVGILTARVIDYANGVGEAFWMVISLAVVFTVIQTMQLPIFFKFGYTKARFFNLIPFVAIMAGYLAFTSWWNGSGISIAVDDFFAGISGGVFIVAAVLALVFIILVSYRLSLSFYKRREF